MQIDKISVGEKIYNIRQQNGYSMEQFGKQIGDAPRGSVNSWEKGVNLPNKERLEMIAVMGNTTVDELLYGSFSDYVSELICSNLGIKLSFQFIIPFSMQLQAAGFSYGDDVEILRYAKGFFNANKIATKRPSLFYQLISQQDNLFIGYLEVGENETVPKYFAMADVKRNRLHIMPYTMNDSGSENYSYPQTITESGGHDYFTSGMIALQLTLRDLSLFYYGLDEKYFYPQISVFIYDVDTDAFIIDKEEKTPEELYSSFFESIQKESLFRNHLLEE